MADLAFMKINQETFSLLSQVSPHYKAIANTLRLEQFHKDRIEREDYNDRITEVFKHWDNRGSQLGYPHTWEGLWDILYYSGLEEVGQSFYDFLNKSF